MLRIYYWLYKNVSYFKQVRAFTGEGTAVVIIQRTYKGTNSVLSERILLQVRGVAQAFSLLSSSCPVKEEGRIGKR